MKTQPFRKSYKPVSICLNYTLIEIIIVVGIMFLMLSIALPSFSDMMRGTGVEAATRNICQALKLTRTHAINNNKYVALLFPMVDAAGNQRPAPDDSGLSDNYYNRSYRYCLVSKDPTTGDYTFQRWIQGESWQLLPAGCAFLEVDQDKGVDGSNGTIGTVDNVDYTELDGNKITGTTNNAKTAAIIFRPSGRIVGLQRYVDIGEATYSGGQAGSLVGLKKDALIDNDLVLSITIDQYTGRVSFGDD